jgi:hypothetical protein
MSFEPPLGVDFEVTAARAEQAQAGPQSGGRELRGPGDRCPFGECDGSGFMFDEASNTAYDCRCRPQRIALAKARHLSAVIPGATGTPPSSAHR